jgi:hypothetical protein
MFVSPFPLVSLERGETARIADGLAEPHGVRSKEAG